MKKLSLLLTFALIYQTLCAALFVDPGTNIICSSNCNEFITTIDSSSSPSLPTLRFAGQNLTALRVASNGFLHTVLSQTSAYCTDIITSYGFICPFYHDLFNGQMYYTVNTSNKYVAITWTNFSGNTFSTPTTLYTFQVVWVYDTTVINNTAFENGDIIFSYGDLVNYGTTGCSGRFPEVGIAWGLLSGAPTAGTTFLPGALSGGQVPSSSIITSRPYWHFRWTGTTYGLVYDPFPNLLVNPYDIYNQNATLFSDTQTISNQTALGSLLTISRPMPFYGQNYRCPFGITIDGCLNATSINVSPCQNIDTAPNDTISCFNSDFSIFQGSGGFVTESLNPNYYAVTWNVSPTSNPSLLRQFQVVWFDKAASIVKGTNTYTFQAGDIAYSYNFTTSTNLCTEYIANSGLTKDASTRTYSPITTNGQIQDPSTFFPNPAGYILFRYDLISNYNTSKVTFP